MTTLKKEMVFINIKINDQVDRLKELIKYNSVTKEGECVELDPNAVEYIAQEYIYQEALNNTKEEEIRKEKAIFYKNKSEFIQKITGLYGKFYFSFYNNLPDIPKQYLFRFIYLSTFLKYNDDRLMMKESNERYKLIYEFELQDILKLSTREYQYTKKALIENKLIKIDNDKTIHINNKLSINGDIGNTKRDYIRVFNNAIQNIYINSTAKDHKKLFILIELLPYVNYNLNVLCFNPEETQPELINPLTLDDISNILDMYKNNKSKLKTLLLNIFVDGKKAMMINKDYKQEFYMVNPCIYYKGNKSKDIELLDKLFRV